MMRIIAVVLATIGLALLPIPLAKAQPNPGCGYVATAWYDPCAQPPPIPGQSNWVPVDGIPGTNGPHGYTPIQD